MHRSTRTVLLTALVGGLLALLAAAPGAATAAGGAGGSLVMAVYGDSPYGLTNADTSQTRATPAFVDTINADPAVDSVVQVGDIHSGKQFCTEAYDRTIASLWTRFDDSLVFTPGDNEWADCHKVAQGGGLYSPATGQIVYVTDPATGQPADYAGGDPLANLSLVRSLFFPEPGRTLGNGNLHVDSQATRYDPAHPEDAAYVENVRWQRKGVQFVTLNIPGGNNNDTDPWYKTPTASDRQLAEVAARTAADLRWLDAAFGQARRDDAKAVVVITQADMWDLDGNVPAHLAQYEPLVADIAQQTTAFARPVLMLVGDSHIYRSDNPLQQGAPCVTEGSGGTEVACPNDEWAIHPGYDVPNLHRVVVHGSTYPMEWLRLTIHTQAQAPTSTSFGPFSWVRQPQPQLNP
jgi:hypothetical protein